MKKLKSCNLLLSIIMLIGITFLSSSGKNINSANSVEFLEHGGFEYIVSDSNIIITGLSDKIKGTPYISIPSKINNMPVTEIDKNAFSFRPDIETVTIPETVKKIDTNAFLGCVNLSAINVDSNNSYFSSYYGVLFDDMYTEIIKYPPKLSYTWYETNSTVTKIAPFAFLGAENLETVIIGKKVSEIGNGAFLNCSSLNYFSLHQANNYLYEEDGVIFSLDKTELIVFPSAFRSSAYTVPNGTKIIRPFAFYCAKNLESVTFPSSLSKLGKYSFYGCLSLKSVEIPSNVSVVSSYSFAFCTALSEVNLNLGVTIVENAAFIYSGSLKEIIIPATVSSIEKDAFDLAPITIKGADKTYAKKFASDNNINFNVSLDPIVGDLNYDGFVNTLDIVLLKKVYLLMIPNDFSLSTIDINDDNEIDLMDIVILKKRFLGIV